VNIDQPLEQVVSTIVQQIAREFSDEAGITFFARGSRDSALGSAELREGLHSALSRLGKRKSVLLIPPDITRLHSRAGELTRYACEYYGSAVTAILPALGTHSPMGADDLQTMFGDLPSSLFRDHDFKNDTITLGHVPGAFVRDASHGTVEYDWPVQVNRLLVEGGFDLILALGQVVPHEVVGMAGYNKSVFVGTGGADGIHKSHFLGAAYGMERLMGRSDTPVRRVLCRAAVDFARDLPIVYAHTVVGRTDASELVTRGLFVGDGWSAFAQAAALSREVNIHAVDEPLHKIVVYLDPREYKSTWLGNKSIYRTRMALADGGEVVVLAPGLARFGEDAEIDRLIRRFGYRGTAATLDSVRTDPDLAHNLAAAAHLIHGSSEGRFRVTYCPGALTREEIESVGFSYAPLDDMLRRYDPARLHEGTNDLGGERVFYISNPATGLWAQKGTR
jgi:nickel-dependent lactate racemase